MASGEAVSLDRGPGGLRAVRRARNGDEQAWTVMGASRGEAGILGEGVRQALLRDPTYKPALAGGPRARRMTSIRTASLGWRPHDGPLDIRVVEDPAAEVAELLVDVAAAGGHVALAGGSTPRRAYELAAETRRRPERGDAVARRRARRAARTTSAPTCAWCASRWPTACPRSAARGVMPVDTALGHDAAAAGYEAKLRETLGNHPRLDLALMGLGPDGHTASLFPGKPAVEETRRLAVGVPEAGMEPQVPRVTLTLRAVQHRARGRVPRRGRRQGRRRAARVRRARRTRPRPPRCVRPGAGTLVLVLDAAAAAELPR